MASVAPVLGMSMMAFGLVMLIGGVGALIYGLRLRYRSKRQIADQEESIVASGPTEVIGG